MQYYHLTELDRFGDVTELKQGWSECSLNQARNAPFKHTKFVKKYQYSNNGYNFTHVVKNAVVPTEWLSAKKNGIKGKKLKELSDKLKARQRKSKVVIENIAHYKATLEMREEQRRHAEERNRESEQRIRQSGQRIGNHWYPISNGSNVDWRREGF